MKSYERLVDTRKKMQNSFALDTLLEFGRKNILDNQFYENLIKESYKSGNAFMTADYQKSILEIAKNMAKLSYKELSEYIYDKVKEDKRFERNR